MENADDPHISSKEVAKGSFWGVVGTIATKVLSFIYLILLARIASQNDVGLFYLSVSIVTFIGIADDLGLVNAIARYVPFYEAQNAKKKAHRLVVLGFVIVTGVALLLMLLLLFGAHAVSSWLQNPQLDNALILISSYLVLNNIFQYVTSFLQAKMDIFASQLVQSIQNLLKLVLTFIFFVIYGASIWTIIVPFLLSYLVSLICSIPLVRPYLNYKLKDPRPVSDIEMLKEAIPFGLVFDAVQFLWGIYGTLDRILLSYLSPAATSLKMVAVYTVATSGAFLLTTFPNSIGTIILPVLSGLYAQKKDAKIQDILNAAQRWCLLVMVPATIIMIVFSYDILHALYGSSYASGSLVMALFSLGFLIQSIGILLSVVLASLRLVKLELKIVLFICLVNIIFNVLLIPHYGMLGCAIAFLITSVVFSYLFYFYSHEQFDFTISEESMRIIAAGIPTFLFTFLLSLIVLHIEPKGSLTFLHPRISTVVYALYLIIAMIMSIASFYAFSIVLKCFKKEDIQIAAKGLRLAHMPKSVVEYTERMLSLGIKY
jgi:O-antigen/teichoic acid export membrane protein